jgi:hypothetical protein
MAPTREIRTCDRCRRLKQRCDQLKPKCSRCQHVRAECTWEGGKRALEADDNESQPDAPAMLPTPSGIAGTGTGPGQPTPPDSSSSDAASRTSPSADDRPIRKRQRTWLSCDRCHRLKVKCDKQLPCARCTSSAREHECRYSDRAQDTGMTSVAHGHMCTHRWRISGNVFREVLRSWKENNAGSSHWRDLESRVSCAGP